MSIQHFSAATGVSGPLAASISPGAWSVNFTNGQSPQDQVFTALANGGQAPYSYSWALIGATGLAFVGGTTSSSCTVRATGSDSEASGTLRCTVTDAAATVVTPEATISVVFGTPP